MEDSPSTSGKGGRISIVTAGPNQIWHFQLRPLALSLEVLQPSPSVLLSAAPRFAVNARVWV